MKKTLLLIAAGFLVAVPCVHATYIDFSSTRYLGFVDAGNEGDAGRTDLLNQLIDLAPGTGPVASVSPTTGNLLTRSLNQPIAWATMPNAVGISNINGIQGSSSGLSTYTGLNFTYMYAKWDGPNFGSGVFYIAGLSSVEIISNLGYPGGQQYGLSGVSFFTPTTTPNPNDGGKVPDGGTTIACLGMALLGLGSMKKLISSKA
jgi:hypothetical protein